MDELIAFLRARTEEDRKIAQSASEVCGCHLPAREWHFNDDEDKGRIVIVDDPHESAVRRQLSRRWNRTHADMFMARHIARWDPARVLVEVEAKRGIIDAAEAARDQYKHADYGHEEGIIAEAWEKAMRQIGEAYAWHPDYRAEWKPTSTPAWTGNEAG